MHNILYCVSFRHKSKVALHASCSMKQLQKTPAIMADKSRSDSFKSVSHYGRGVGVLYGLHHGCRFCWASRCNYMLLLINSSDKICIHELGINPQNLKKQFHGLCPRHILFEGYKLGTLIYIISHNICKVQPKNT